MSDSNSYRIVLNEFNEIIKDIKIKYNNTNDFSDKVNIFTTAFLVAYYPMFDSNELCKIIKQHSRYFNCYSIIEFEKKYLIGGESIPESYKTASKIMYKKIADRFEDTDIDITFSTKRKSRKLKSSKLKSRKRRRSSRKKLR